MVFLVAPRGAQEPRQQWPRWRKVTMPKLSLMFDNELVREVPVGSRPVTIGRAPDNDLSVDNLAVSSYHAKIFFEGGRMVIEDLNSLNGTFVNDLRVERATLHDGDKIHIGKHIIKVETSGAAPVPWQAGRKSAMATIKLRGWFKPQMAVQINQRDDGYYLGPGDKVPTVNGRPISGPTRLNDGDLIEVSGVKLNFIFRE